eukprot:Sspe_Gene.49197::Locus_26255_Transcript_1_2_Confidence_0.667_Length_422::g.49197::m.49197
MCMCGGYSNLFFFGFLWMAQVLGWARWNVWKVWSVTMLTTEYKWQAELWPQCGSAIHCPFLLFVLDRGEGEGVGGRGERWAKIQDKMECVFSPPLLLPFQHYRLAVCGMK